MEMTGSQILIESLKREGVEVIFGIPGGVVIPVFDDLYKQDDIKVVLTRHEQGAAHAADGYGRATGKPGVCLVTSGPAATNTVTGLATSQMDSSPMVVITGQVPTFAIGSDAFQEADTTGVARPVSKHVFLVKGFKDVARVVREAFHIAATGRPGPVLIDIPKDVIMAKTEFVWPEKINIRGYKPTTQGHSRQIEKAAQMIMEANACYLYVGGGIIASDAADEVRQLAEKIKAPVTTTLMGLGAFPGDHSLFVGMPGMHGTRCANMSFQECELIISVGVRFDDRVTGKLDAFAPQAKVIHIDIDPAAISKNVKVDIPVVGDAKKILRELNKLLKPKERNGWNDKIDAWKSEFPLIYDQSDEVIKPQYVIDQMDDLCDKDKTIVITDVGQHQMWTAQYYKFTKCRTHITSGGLGTMGFGLPACMGAYYAKPDHTIINLSGDGSFVMNSQELATISENRMPIKAFIINNLYLGMVRQWQELFFENRYSATYLGVSPDFVKLAEAYGIPGIRATKPSEVRPLIQQALSMDGPVVVDFIVDQMENVYPMVPAGKAIHEMVGGLVTKDKLDHMVDGMA